MDDLGFCNGAKPSKVFEENYLKEQLKRFKGSIAKTSTFIGMDRSALHRKLKELDIDINKHD